MQLYAKALVAVAGAVAIALYSALNGDNHVSPEEAINIAIAGATAVAVWLAANVPNLTVAKSVVAGVLAVLNLLVSELTGGIDSAEIVNLVIAFAVAAGVWITPNAPAPASLRRADTGL